MKVSESDVLNASILLVDDQENNIDLLRQLLGDAGYTRVASAGECYAVVKKELSRLLSDVREFH